MNWIPYPENRPDSSGTYHVTIQRPYAGGDITFHYAAYFDADTNRWHKYDGFVDDSIKEVIEERIVGWQDKTGTLIR
jgi:hypothetical protein